MEYFLTEERSLHRHKDQLLRKLQQEGCGQEKELENISDQEPDQSVMGNQYSQSCSTKSKEVCCSLQLSLLLLNCPTVSFWCTGRCRYGISLSEHVFNSDRWGLKSSKRLKRRAISTIDFVQHQGREKSLSCTGWAREQSIFWINSWVQTEEIAEDKECHVKLQDSLQVTEDVRSVLICPCFWCPHVDCGLAIRAKSMILMLCKGYLWTPCSHWVEKNPKH
jgi:hypothetical protein